MPIAVAKKTSIDKRLFVQFITAVRQIEASSRVAEDNVNHFKVGKYNVWRQWPDRNISEKSLLSAFCNISVTLRNSVVQPFRILLQKQHTMEMVAVKTEENSKSREVPVKSPPTIYQYSVVLRAGCPSYHPTNSVKALTTDMDDLRRVKSKTGTQNRAARCDIQTTADFVRTVIAILDTITQL